MPKVKKLQTNFSAGELAPELGMRQDTDQYANGAKSLLNRRCLIGGGTTRRPGLGLLVELPGASRAIEFVVNLTTSYVLNFSDGAVSIYSLAGVLQATVTGCAWTGTIYETMDYVQSGNTMFLVHPSMIPQVLVRASATSWSTAAFTFYTTGGRTEQPYFKVAAASMTMQPSAIAGVITLTASAAYFVAAHVGTKIRYLNREISITAVAATGLTATATVIQQLPITQILTVADTSQFAVGDSIEGATTTAEGTVTAITDATHMNAVPHTGLTQFAAEVIVGPNGRTACSAVANTAAAAVTTWDEQLFSPLYGYPAAVALHRNRLLFAGHPAVPNALIGSVIDNLYNFNLGTGLDAEAIFELIGDAGAAAIVQLHSAEQLLVFTDHGPYYVPESQTVSFKPSSMAFFPFGSPWPVSSTVKTRAFDGGVMFTSGSLIIKARPTGNFTQMWDADEVSLLSSHVVKTPTSGAVTSNFAGGPERYALCLNSDGTLAVLQLVEAQKIRNLTPWETTGIFTSICCIQAQVFVTSRRVIAGNTRYYLEVFDQDVTVDCASTYATRAAMDLGVPLTYGGTDVNVVTEDYHLGLYPPAVTTLPAGPYTVGLNFVSTTETLPPVLDDREGSGAGQYMRIVRAYVHVLESARFTANGYTLTAYQTIDDVTAPPPRRTGPQMFELMGWQREPTLTISQADPLPLTILGIKLEVAF